MTPGLMAFLGFVLLAIALAGLWEQAVYYGFLLGIVASYLYYRLSR